MIEKGKIPTELEIEIVQRLADGATASQVAKDGAISKKGMESRILRLRRKYGFKSISGLCVYFAKKGWIS